MNDIQYAIRQLLKNPGFTIVAVLTLALGIGATTAITSVVRTALFDPLPMEHPERYLNLYAHNTKTGFPDNGLNPIAAREVEAAKELFRNVALHEQYAIMLEGSEFEQQIVAERVTEGFFRLVHAVPSLGRLPADDEYHEGAPGVMVLSYTTWQSIFGGDPAILGRSLNLKQGTKEGRYTVIGVMPREFRFPWPYVGGWLAWPGPSAKAGDVPNMHQGTSVPHTRVLAELQPDATQEQAQAWLDLLQGRQAKDDSMQADYRFLSQKLSERFSQPELQRTLWALLAVTMIVLLIASANIANLQLARTESRRQELAVRTALGAGRWRVFRHLLVESLLLAFVGGVAGLLVTWYGLDLLTNLLPGELLRLRTIQLDRGVLLVASLVTLMTGVLFGVIPAWRGGQTHVNETLKLGGASTTASRQRLGFTGALVVGQVALTLILLTGAGLMVRSVQKLLSVDVGFDPINLVKLNPMDPKFNLTDKDFGAARRQAKFDDLRQRLAAIPGVEAVGLSEPNIRLIEATNEAGAKQEFQLYWIGTEESDPFRAMRARLKEGRWLTQSDAAAGNTVMVNEAASRRFWPGENAAGKRIQFKTMDDNTAEYQVVGIITDIREQRFNEDPAPTIFAPTRVMEVNDVGRPLVIRTTVPNEGLRIAFERETKAAGLGQRQPAIVSMEQQLYTSTAGHRAFMNYLLVFAITGLGLSALGLYGVLTYNVAKRTKEIGIRMALGAARGEVIELIIRQGMKLVIVGVVLGLAGTLVASQLLRSFLFGIAPNDPVTFVSVSLLLLAVALVACWLPARHAAKVDPMIALRSE